MRENYTDSQTVEYHDDGSWTTTTIVTEYPATTAEKAAAWGILGTLLVASTVPVFGPIVYEKIQDRREKKRQQKLEVVEDK